MLDHNKDDLILWLDLEMTGLDPAVDVITEFAAVITDSSFNVIAQVESGVSHDPDKLDALLAANPWYQEQGAEHIKAIREASLSGMSVEASQQTIIDLLDEHKAGSRVVLAGNTISTDRLFVNNYWPLLNSKLHYRMLDVTAFKIVGQSSFGLAYDKKETHRALDDILESINELKFYMEAFKNG